MDRNRHLRESGKKGEDNIPALLCNTIGLLLILAVFAVLAAAFLPQLLGVQTYTIATGSMEPEVPVGSLVVVEPAVTTEIAPDEIVAFSGGSSVITHRVVKNSVVEGQLITKGDANEEADMTPVSYDAVIGVVTHVYPKVGGLLQTALTPAGRICLFGILLCGVLFWVLGGRLQKQLNLGEE